MSTAIREAIERAIEKYVAIGYVMPEASAALVDFVAAEIAAIDSCLAKVKPGEPIFVLRGQDMLAPHFVRAWATLAHRESHLVTINHASGNFIPDERYREAIQKSWKMEDWPNRKYPD